MHMTGRELIQLHCISIDEFHSGSTNKFEFTQAILPDAGFCELLGHIRLGASEANYETLIASPLLSPNIPLVEPVSLY
jgi:hypothetical protein